MKDNRCFICKFQQLERPKVSNDLLFDNKGKSMRLPLCYSHSVELYKGGQKKFLTHYKNIFVDSYGTESDSLIVNFFSGQKLKSW